jgi:hypothetical protein
MANAFGAERFMIRIRGIFGSPAAMVISSTTFHSCGASCLLISTAPDPARRTLSPPRTAISQSTSQISTASETPARPPTSGRGSAAIPIVHPSAPRRIPITNTRIHDRRRLLRIASHMARQVSGVS